MGQQPKLWFQLKTNVYNDFNGHFCTAIVTHIYIVKRLYGRKSFMQHDLGKKKLNILTFFVMGQFF